jgi:hypothetical protein
VSSGPSSEDAANGFGLLRQLADDGHTIRRRAPGSCVMGITGLAMR